MLAKQLGTARWKIALAPPAQDGAAPFGGRGRRGRGRKRSRGEDLKLGAAFRGEGSS